LRRGHGGIAHIPAQGLEKRIDQRLADMGFLPEFDSCRLFSPIYTP
jgi:hypothetical protein